MEEWKNIKNSQKYQVSSLGRIKNLNYRKSGKEKIIKQTLSPKGYYHVHLIENGRILSQRVNRHVAEAFIPNPENKSQVNHINGIKTDNRVENLEWVDNGENQKHAYRNGLREARKGRDNEQSKKVMQFDLEGNYIKTWDSIADAKRFYNGGDISKVCKGKLKKTKNFIWKYDESS